MGQSCKVSRLTGPGVTRIQKCAKAAGQREGERARPWQRVGGKPEQSAAAAAEFERQQQQFQQLKFEFLTFFVQDILSA